MIIKKKKPLTRIVKLITPANQWRHDLQVKLSAAAYTIKSYIIIAIKIKIKFASISKIQADFTPELDLSLVRFVFTI